jgi:hypothetical protein
MDATQAVQGEMGPVVGERDAFAEHERRQVEPVATTATSGPSSRNVTADPLDETVDLTCESVEDARLQRFHGVLADDAAWGRSSTCAQSPCGR